MTPVHWYEVAGHSQPSMQPCSCYPAAVGSEPNAKLLMPMPLACTAPPHSICLTTCNCLNLVGADGGNEPKVESLAPMHWLGLAILAYMAYNAMTPGSAGGARVHEISFQEFKSKLLAQVWGRCGREVRGARHLFRVAVRVEVCSYTPPASHVRFRMHQSTRFRATHVAIHNSYLCYASAILPLHVDTHPAPLPLLVLSLGRGVQARGGQQQHCACVRSA